jgi:hypothetical protein
MDEVAPIAPIKFSLPMEFGDLLRQCFARSQLRLQLFDPDFTSWAMGSAEVTGILRTFLLANKKSRIELAMHKQDFLERECPRFMRLLTDFSHAIECRITPKNLRQLTDSFCIADDLHIVRRFHCDHFRGEAVFDNVNATLIWSERFAEIWKEAGPALRVSTFGL